MENKETEEENISESEDLRGGTLFIVATPLGNIGDWTERAKQVLGRADIVAAEDTRLLKAALAKIKIKPKKVISHHDHNEEASTKALISDLLAGKDIALASDAGTPLISDPGHRLVSAARAAQIRIVPIPGPSALAAALSVAALGGISTFFGGFLPTQCEVRKKYLRRHRNSAETLLFFEAPHRIREMLADCETVLGGTTQAVVCRELTKPYEEIFGGTITQIRQKFNVEEPRGEFVLLFKSPPLEFLTQKETQTEVEKLLRLGQSASNILEELQPQTEVTRKQLYDMISSAKKSLDPDGVR